MSQGLWLDEYRSVQSLPNPRVAGEWDARALRSALLPPAAPICCDSYLHKRHGTPRGTMSISQHGPHHAYPNFDQQPVTMGQLRWYMEGMRHARLATVFGILAIFSLGALFGPLAIARSKKAEAFGVPAPEDGCSAGLESGCSPCGWCSSLFTWR